MAVDQHVSNKLANVNPNVQRTDEKLDISAYYCQHVDHNIIKSSIIVHMITHLSINSVSRPGTFMPRALAAPPI